MAQTVEQLAETVGASVERLLSQMKEAGLSHSAAEEEVSEEDKQTLLAALKRSHGEGEAAPRKITLKRKQLSTLRTGGGGKRTVNVEVRKKRTYVKRDEQEEVTGEELEAAATAVEGAKDPSGTADGVAETALHASESLTETTASIEGEEAALESTASSDAIEPESEGAVETVAPVELEDEDLSNLDPEVLRQRATARRKAEANTATDIGCVISCCRVYHLVCASVLVY